MLMPNKSLLKSQVDALQAEIQDLRKHIDAKAVLRGITGGFKTSPRKSCEEAMEKAQQEKNQHLNQHRLARVSIARGVALTTQPGSVYSTIAKVLGQLGRLDRQDSLFEQFKREHTSASAHRLLQKISVSREDIEKAARADDEFQEHCENRTIQYKALAAKGNKKYQRILQDRQICDGKGNWRGDFDEALSILSGARTISQVQRGKNLGILNKAKLMFDTFMIGDEQFCVLYRQKWHRLLKHALALVNL